MDLNKFTEQAKILIQSAQMKALGAGHQIFMPEYLLKVMLEDELGLVQDLINACGGNVQSISDAVDSAIKKFPVVEGLAMQGKLDPVIGRDEEIRRTMQVSRRLTKNNPVLIGEPGVGKTAIVEGLANRIVANDVPLGLRDAKVLALDRGALIAGRSLEENLKKVGAGAISGAMDASNLLKPALARGEIRCIGVTTLDEYREHIEKDPALARRFQPVFISQPTETDTISILRGLRERYEVHHGIRITDGAIIAAATLSNRYITDRFLPDKAIDLIDEAASRVRIEMDSKPEVIDELERKVIQLKIAAETLKKESNENSKQRLKK
ncbi:unnamed protein product [Parnassius apollo]|uniref:(apollo) hypothetical protein n=1 Tax=Parnassius apollo TaxID=110799 RepID=A0A8S3Y7T8_PARAO|nr:unnamed protein product [Parnassius apollo]